MMLFIISGPSGTGKTTLSKRLVSELPNITLSISSTTRKPRLKEKHGIDYFFCTVEEFEKKITQNEFIEWSKVYGNYYGTSKKFLEDCFNKNQSVLLNIDVQGADKIRKNFKNSYSLFITPPSLEELKKRLIVRGTDSLLAIEERMQQAIYEIQQKDFFDAQIMNADVEEAYEEFKNFIKKKLNLYV